MFVSGLLLGGVSHSVVNKKIKKIKNCADTYVHQIIRQYQHATLTHTTAEPQHHTGRVKGSKPGQAMQRKNTTITTPSTP